MVLSRLRRCFSSKSSASAAYSRLPSSPLPPPPRPIYDARPPPIPTLRPVPIAAGDLKTTPPRPAPLADGDSGLLKTTPPPPVSTGDGDSELLKTTPPHPVSTGGGDCGRAEDAPRSPDGDSGLLKTTPPPPVSTGDGDYGRAEDAPARAAPIGGGSGEEEKTSAMYRIENELKAMNEESATHCSFGPVGDGGDIFRWEGVVIGPAHSCYEGGIFRVSIDLPSDYPSNPPEIKFQTKIFHPNIEVDGTIHIDILKENWSPALTIEKLLLSICSILSNPEAQHSINEASMMYKNEWFRYCEVAREWTKIYAMPS